jgi:hypothetical protein
LVIVFSVPWEVWTEKPSGEPWVLGNTGSLLDMGYELIQLITEQHIFRAGKLRKQELNAL